MAKSLAVYGKRDKRYPGGVRYALHIPAAIHRKREQSGRLQPGVQDNTALWDKIRNLDKNAAKQTAVTIVRFAKEHGARVIVFEHLRRYRPPKEKMSRSAPAFRECP